MVPGLLRACPGSEWSLGIVVLFPAIYMLVLLLPLTGEPMTLSKNGLAGLSEPTFLVR